MRKSVVFPPENVCGCRKSNNSRCSFNHGVDYRECNAVAVQYMGGGGGCLLLSHGFEGMNYALARVALVRHRGFEQA